MTCVPVACFSSRSVGQHAINEQHAINDQHVARHAGDLLGICRTGALARAFAGHRAPCVSAGCGHHLAWDSQE